MQKALGAKGALSAQKRRTLERKPQKTEIIAKIQSQALPQTANVPRGTITHTIEFKKNATADSKRIRPALNDQTHKRRADMISSTAP